MGRLNRRETAGGEGAIARRPRGPREVVAQIAGSSRVPPQADEKQKGRGGARGPGAPSNAHQLHCGCSRHGACVKNLARQL